MDQGIDVVGASRSMPPADVMLPYRWGKKPAAFRFEHIDLNKDLDRLFELIRKERCKVHNDFETLFANELKKPIQVLV